MMLSRPVTQPHAQFPAQQQRARNDIYLPAMPEMLQSRAPASSPTSAAGSSAPGRYARNDGRSATPADRNQPTVVRGQAPDEPGRATAAWARIPTPEQLGLLPDQNAQHEAQGAQGKRGDHLDWTAARQRLDRLGALTYRLEKSAGEGFCFTCVLPHQGSTERQFEARAASEAEAVELALRQAEEWARGR